MADSSEPAPWSDRADGRGPRRVSELFRRALACEPASRDAFLDDVCRGDRQLRDELAALLAVHEQSAGGGRGSAAGGSVALGSGSMPGDSLVGRTLNRYGVKRKLGEGGMGVVYLAEDTTLGRPVALKVLGTAFTRDHERRERLRREARAAAGLSHSGIAVVYALEECDDVLFMVSEYVPGRTLRDELAAEGPLVLSRLLSTGVQIANALAAAHERGVIHRDLKPENVMRTGDGTVKVLDFGLAQVREPKDAATRTRLTEPGSVLGTLGYSAPEQLRGGRVDARSDLFSFGVMLYELASGAHPFISSTPASTIAHVLETEPPSVVEHRAGIPPALEQVVCTCLQKDPSRRFPSARALVHTLDRIAPVESGVDPASGPVPAPVPVTGPKRLARPIDWWRFHQVIIGLVYYLTLVPMWAVRQQVSRPWGAVLFFSVVVTVGIAATLRFHLAFVSRIAPSELAAQRHRARWPVTVTDGLFVVLLLVAAGAMAPVEVALTSLLLSIAVGSAVAFLVIEPATARAAFRRPPSRSSRRARRRARTSVRADD